MPKDNIHPQYFENKIRCTTCNNEFVTGTTKKDEIHVDTCSNCHPFFTSKTDYSEKRGRIEVFRRKMKKKDALVSKIKQDSELQKNLNKKINKTNSKSNEKNKE